MGLVIGFGRYLIRTYSNEGDIILDNASGSGSFLEAALLENRYFIGIEKEKEYYDISLQRLRSLKREVL